MTTGSRRLQGRTLDKRIEIWRASIVDDGMRRKPGPPALAFKRWANKRDVTRNISDAEPTEAAQQVLQVSTRFTVRVDEETSTITGADTIKHRGRTYQIVGIGETDERNDGIVISTLALPDQPLT